MTLRISVCILVLAFLINGCGEEKRILGRYTSDPTPSGMIILSLNENGRAEWMTDIDTASMRWEQRGQEVWLHTKEGGVIRGILKDSALRLTLPGVGVILFKKEK